MAFQMNVIFNFRLLVLLKLEFFKIVALVTYL